MNSTEESVFSQAMDIQCPQERSLFLDRACADDALLRSRVDTLISAYAEGEFLETPAFPMATTLDLALLAEGPGTIIGRYKLLEEIGEGGMGVVYRAEQREPVRRQVALKVIKPGMDSRQIIARFEAERQALAMMDHPNIAHVFDGGATDSGRPYFVMELVDGVPITEYCDAAELTIEERLDLFASVCDAVHHAHQKGIIHRDLKPTNILVTLHGQTPVPKIIDFGVAKATHHRLTEETVVTAFGHTVGTPLYMSPEQAAIGGQNIDTGSDIYSLGVLLYELLTGTTPFDKARFQQTGYHEICRIIREEEPPAPSTRIRVVGEAATTIATHRKISPAKLNQTLHGELDWIVMKTLEKDRARRYETSSDFAVDVRRYLNHEPVAACPPTTWYRLRKYVQRRKAQLIITFLLVATVLLATAAIWVVVRDKQGKEVARVAVPEGGTATIETAAASNIASATKPARLPPWSLPPGSPLPAIAPFNAAKAKEYQAAWSKHLGVPVELINSIGMRFALIPPGEFDMGSTEADVQKLVGQATATNEPRWYTDRVPAEGPQHRVRITRPFYLGRCEVTQAQYEQVVGSNPSGFKGDPTLPVDTVNWYLASEFCRSLGDIPQEQAVGAEYRLPTEAEWEYACRAGTTSMWYSGDDAGALKEHGWFNEARTHPVGEKAPNAWGLYDVHGNVWEWCQDRYLWTDSYYATSPVEDPPGASGGLDRVFRGGGWYDSASFARASFRYWQKPGFQNERIGFRLARIVTKLLGIPETPPEKQPSEPVVQGKEESPAKPESEKS